jgi:hypothetical protein
MKTMRRNQPTREYQPDQPSFELTRPAPDRLHGPEEPKRDRY